MPGRQIQRMEVHKPRNGQRIEQYCGHCEWFAGNLLAQQGSGKAFVLVGVTGFEPVASAA
jgi:hypothetical protein